MPFECKTLAETQAVHKALTAENEYLHYCTFSNAFLECGHFDGVFIASTFQDMEWYRGLFNMAIFVGRAIENGIFVDTSFADCRIVQFGFKKCLS